MTDTQGILETVEAYLKAIKTGGEEDFRRAFYWNAVVINANGDNPEESAVSIEDFWKRVKGRNDSGHGGEEIAHGVSISQLGGAANVRLDFELVMGEKRMWGTDFFNMVKTGDQWKIAQKIFAVTH